MACHRVAFPFMALRLWEVEKFTVECIHTKNGSDEKYPQDNIVCYHIPAHGSFPACKCYVYDHQELRPEVMKELEKKYSVKWSEATLFVGTKGYLDNNARVIPESEHRRFPVPPKTLVRAKAGGPVEDLYACIRTGGTPRFQFHRRGRPADGNGPDRAPRSVRRRWRQDRVGRREDAVRQQAGDQQVRPARIPQRMGSVA